MNAVFEAGNTTMMMDIYSYQVIVWYSSGMEWLGHYTCPSVTKQYNLVLAKGL